MTIHNITSDAHKPKHDTVAWYAFKASNNTESKFTVANIITKQIPREDSVANRPIISERKIIRGRLHITMSPRSLMPPGVSPVTAPPSVSPVIVPPGISPVIAVKVSPCCRVTSLSSLVPPPQLPSARREE